MKKANNRGVTLIELVVAAAILTVVIGVGMSFIVHATNIFNRGNGESNLQNEAQLTMARLQNLIVNSTHGVSIAPPDGTPVGDPAAGGTGVNLYVYNREETDEANGGYNVIRYTVTHIYQSGEQLMYDIQEYALKANGSFGLVPKGTARVLSDYITDFQVNLDDFAKKRSVKVTLGFKNQNQTFSTTNTFLLRNAISDKTDGAADDYFMEDATADKKNEITALKISPTDVYVWQGSSLAGPFSVAAQVGDQWKSGASVVWSLTAPDGTDASISRATGSIQVGPAVTGNLSAHATALSSLNAVGSDQSRYVVSNEAIIHVKSFEDVSLSNPLPLSSDNHKTYEAVFSVIGGNLEKDIDMRDAPFVAAGSDLTATFEKQTDSSGPACLRWKVIIRRPAAYSGKLYSLVVGYKLNGQTKTCKVDGISFTPSADEEAQGVAEVRLWDETAGVAYAMTGSIHNIPVMRGSVRNLQLQVRYGGGAWQIKDSNDWSITSDSPDVKVMQDGLGYHLTVDVKNYTGTVDVGLTTRYTDNHGENKEGPSLMLTCSPVKIRLSGVTGSFQKKFPVARGATESLSFVIDNLDGAAVVLLADKSDAGSSSTMRVAVNGKNASVTVASGQRSSMNFCFGVRTADGEQLPEDICCELTFVPDDANVFLDNVGNLTKTFLPRAADLTSYSAQIAVPGEGESAMIYAANGKKVVYTMTGGKYYIEYDGKKYVYDTGWRGWIPAA